MINIIETTNYTLAILGILLLLSSSVLVVDYYTSRVFERFLLVWGIPLAFIVSLGATTLTFIYSDVFGFIPCGLCWMQRVFLFPQVLLIAVALYTKDTAMARNGLALSLAGLTVSLYHHYLQLGGIALVKCPAAGVGADCAKRYFFEFGFMTFPLMAASTFIFLAVLYWYLLPRMKPA